MNNSGGNTMKQNFNILTSTSLLRTLPKANKKSNNHKIRSSRLHHKVSGIACLIKVRIRAQEEIQDIPMHQELAIKTKIKNK